MIQLQGVLQDIKQRWTPDGSLAVIASLMIPRPLLGPTRAKCVSEQPIPLRADGKAAEFLTTQAGKHIQVSGVLRRRYYSRDGEERWGQVELWVSASQETNAASQQDIDFIGVSHER